MDWKKMRIVFMGTPVFAETSLKALVQAGANVVVVVTVADKQQGRGQVTKSSPVKDFATTHNIPVLQPTHLKSLDFIEALKQFKPDLGVVVAFRMLPEAVWNMPPLGTINLHGSILPAYRGAAPINHAIINGESETGVTIFKLKHEIDTGDVLIRRKMPIGPEENAGQLHDRMMIIGAEALLEAIREIATGSPQYLPQADLMTGKTPPPAPKIFRENCYINWAVPSKDVHNLIRGLSPYPGAWTKNGDSVLKIFRGEKSAEKCTALPGTIRTAGNNTLEVACSDYWYSIHELQPEGKRKMSVDEFLRGYHSQLKSNMG